MISLSNIYLVYSFLILIYNYAWHLQGAGIDLNLPRRSLLVQFTCNLCGERTKRLVNRLAYERGAVFVQVSIISWVLVNMYDEFVYLTLMSNRCWCSLFRLILFSWLAFVQYFIRTVCLIYGYDRCSLN